MPIIHKTARSQERAFSIGWGGGPKEVRISADKDGLLRLTGPRGAPIEEQPLIETLHPEMEERIRSAFGSVLEPPPAPPDEDEQAVTVSAPEAPKGRRIPQKDGEV